MSPVVKSMICAMLLAVVSGGVTGYFWHQTAGSIVSGVMFVVGLILFGRLFNVPPRSDAHY